MTLQLLGDLLKGISQFGNQPVIVIGTVILLSIYLLFAKKLEHVVFLFFAVLSYPYSLILKNLFKIESVARENMPMYFEGDKYTFPSSHVIFYTVFFGYLLYLTLIKDKSFSKLSEQTLRFFSAVMIIFIGFSRIYLGYHTVIDVLAGYVFGGFYLLLVVVLSKLESNKSR